MVDTDSSGTEGGDNDYGEATGVLHTWDLVQWVACRWCMRVTFKRVQALREQWRLGHLVVLRHLNGLVPVGLGVRRFLGTPRDQRMGPLAVGKVPTPRPALWSPLWWQWGTTVRPTWGTSSGADPGQPRHTAGVEGTPPWQAGRPLSEGRGNWRSDLGNYAWAREWTRNRPGHVTGDPGAPPSWVRGEANADSWNSAWERWWMGAPANGAAEDRAPRALALHLAAASLANLPSAGARGGQAEDRRAVSGGGSAGGGSASRANGAARNHNTGP